MTPSTYTHSSFSRRSNYSARNNRSNSNHPEALIEKNRGFVLFALGPLFRRYEGLTPDDRADLESAGYLALCKAADTHDPARGAFSTHAVLCIQFAGRKALARIGDPKARAAGVVVSSLDAPLLMDNNAGAVQLGDVIPDETAAGAFAALLDDADGQDRAARLWSWVRSNLTEKQALALWLYYGEGKTYEEAAQTLGVARQNIGGAVSRGLVRLRQAAEKASTAQSRQLFGAE